MNTPALAKIASFFDPQNPNNITREMVGYEHRQEQIDMAVAVASAIEQKKTIILEAGTGVGKTLAYLLPAMLCNQKIVISTATKTLQDQVVDKDIPLLAKTMAPKELNYCVLKGRQNYLCRRKLEYFSLQTTISLPQEGMEPFKPPKWSSLIRAIKEWAKITPEGDLSEFFLKAEETRRQEILSEDQLRFYLSSSFEQCLGSNCSFNSSCFIKELRRKAQKVRLIIVNHHLLCADLAGKENGFFEIIPPADVLIMDEAHHLPEIIAHSFTTSYESLSIRNVAYELRIASGSGGQNFDTFKPILAAVETLHDRIHGLISKSVSRGDHITLRCFARKGGSIEAFHEQITALRSSYEDLLNLLSNLEGESFEGCKRMIKTLMGALVIPVTREHGEADGDADRVYWMELRSRGFALHATPVHTAPFVSQVLFKHYPTAVFTSATMAVKRKDFRDFGFFKQQIGLTDNVREICIQSPYRYKEQMVIFIPPPTFPAPEHPAFLQEVIKTAVPIIEEVTGGALFLCTSYNNMALLAEALQTFFPGRVLVQGKGSRRSLLRSFKEDGRSILVATGTFWEGVDIPGRSLQVVLIDRLPFMSPDDPLFEGKSRLLVQNNLDPFWHYQLPKAVLALRQGVGRLIRSSKDKGIVAIFDVRLRTKPYGKAFMINLPEGYMVDNLKDLKNQWQHLLERS